jgi:hypothetical protein
VNPLRIRLLTEIDAREPHTSTATIAELTESFRHEKHWHNWANLWHLNYSRDAAAQSVTFSRRPKGSL